MRRYQDRLYNAVVHIVGCRSEAEDVVQDAFVQAFVKLSTFKHNSKFDTWLYRIAINVSISHRRRRKVEVSIEQAREATGLEPLDGWPAPSDFLEQEERREKLEEAMQLLTVEHRTIIVLRHMEDFAYEKMAEILKYKSATEPAPEEKKKKKVMNCLSDPACPLRTSLPAPPRRTSSPRPP